MRGAESEQVRLAELVAALSLGIDLGFDQPMEHVLRQCLIALRLAEHRGLDEETRASVYYAAMLVNIGCHTDAHEQAKWFGDDIAFKGDKYAYGLRSLRGAVAGLKRIGSGADTRLDRVRIGFEFASGGVRDMNGMIAQHAAMTRRLGQQLELPTATIQAMAASYEQWDGHGWPGDLSADEVPVASRITTISEYVEVAHRTQGVEAARELMMRARGKQFDPDLVDDFCANADILLAGLDDVETFAAVIDAEPSLTTMLDEDAFDAALLAIADFVDLKSPYSLGHGRAVAALAEGAGEALGMGPDQVRTLKRAGLVHAYGKLGVSNAILDKVPPLGVGERERLRMIPYVTQRMLRQSSVLAPLGAIAVQCSERLDGSGHPSGLSGAAIGREARVLGAADTYTWLREPKAHRDPLSAEEAAARLRAEAKAGRLDADAVEAVLGAAGHRTSRRTAGPAGLTAREIDVLRLIARGLSTRDVAERLVISRKTAGNHVEHIYAKIGCSNRAGAALFATQHGLLVGEETALAP